MQTKFGKINWFYVYLAAFFMLWLVVGPIFYYGYYQPAHPKRPDLVVEKMKVAANNLFSELSLASGDMVIRSNNMGKSPGHSVTCTYVINTSRNFKESFQYYEQEFKRHDWVYMSKGHTSWVTNGVNYNMTSIVYKKGSEYVAIYYWVDPPDKGEQLSISISWTKVEY